MPRLMILYDRARWALDAKAAALERWSPAEYQVQVKAWSPQEADVGLGPEAPDVIVSLSSSALKPVRDALLRRDWKSRVVGWWGAGWPLRAQAFHDAYEQTDFLLIGDRATWSRMGRLPNTEVLLGSVDPELFHVTREIGVTSPKVIWAGSISEVAVNGYHTRVLPLMQELRRAGTACKALLIDSLAGDAEPRRKLAAWYNLGSVFLCAGDAESALERCLEAAACGCTLVSVRAGGMTELIEDGVNGCLVEPGLDALRDGVSRALADPGRLAARMQEDIRSWHDETRARDFYDSLDRLLDQSAHSVVVSDGPSRNGRRTMPPAVARPEVGGELTVFVSTIGAPSFEACLRLLELQDCVFPVQVIENVAPMSAAFQVMIDRCRTPFYVQVDEDMLLHPHAIGHLLRWIKGSAENVAACVGPLLDAHLRQNIYGVKIFRHGVVRDFPHRDVEASEADQLRRLEAAGFACELAPIPDPRDHGVCLGIHGTHYTTTSIFERYATLERKRRRDPTKRNWLTACAPIFLERYQACSGALALATEHQAPMTLRDQIEQERDLELHALMGWLAGSLAELNGRGGEKDFRRYFSSPALAATRRFVRELSELVGEPASIP